MKSTDVYNIESSVRDVEEPTANDKESTTNNIVDIVNKRSRTRSRTKLLTSLLSLFVISTLLSMLFIWLYCSKNNACKLMPILATLLSVSFIIFFTLIKKQLKKYKESNLMYAKSTAIAEKYEKIKQDTIARNKTIRQLMAQEAALIDIAKTKVKAKAEAEELKKIEDWQEPQYSLTRATSLKINYRDSWDEKLTKVKDFFDKYVYSSTKYINKLKLQELVLMCDSMIEAYKGLFQVDILLDGKLASKDLTDLSDNQVKAKTLLYCSIIQLNFITAYHVLFVGSETRDPATTNDMFGSSKAQLSQIKRILNRQAGIKGQLLAQKFNNELRETNFYRQCCLGNTIIKELKQSNWDYTASGLVEFLIMNNPLESDIGKNTSALLNLLQDQADSKGRKSNLISAIKENASIIINGVPRKETKNRVNKTVRFSKNAELLFYKNDDLKESIDLDQSTDEEKEGAEGYTHEGIFHATVYPIDSGTSRPKIEVIEIDDYSIDEEMGNKAASKSSALFASKFDLGRFKTRISLACNKSSIYSSPLQKIVLEMQEQAKILFSVNLKNALDNSNN